LFKIFYLSILPLIVATMEDDISLRNKFLPGLSRNNSLNIRFRVSPNRAKSAVFLAETRPFRTSGGERRARPSDAEGGRTRRFPNASAAADFTPVRANEGGGGFARSSGLCFRSTRLRTHARARVCVCVYIRVRGGESEGKVVVARQWCVACGGCRSSPSRWVEKTEADPRARARTCSPGVDSRETLS